MNIDLDKLESLLWEKCNYYEDDSWIIPGWNSEYFDFDTSDSIRRIIELALMCEINEPAH